MRKNILLVEYATATIDNVKEILSHPIFHITVADEGELAKKLLKENKFDLMITAAMLPRFHGFSLSQHAAENYPDIKIIIISGIYKGYEYKHKAITQYRANDFFEKPLDKTLFLKRVFELLEIKPEDLKAKRDISTTRIPRVDTSKLPKMKKIKEEERKLTSEDLFGDIIKKVEDTPTYEIKLDDEPEKKGTDTLTTQKIKIDIDRLVKPEAKERDEKKFKRIEEDISKKFEDTLSGLGISPSSADTRKDDTQKVHLPESKAKEAGIPAKKGAETRPPETVELGDYEILGLIARGGMAEIYKAKKKGVKGFEKIIALKKILASYVEDEKYIEMFVDEAKIAAQLSHANIVQIYDLGQKDDYYFIAMEYVLGKDLRLILRKLSEVNKSFPEELALYLIIKILAALNYAHSAVDSRGKHLEIVHRDISPPNILVSFDGNIKLTDFGVSKATTKMHQTVSGALKGKLLYMSPEQARGDSDIDYRSDLYSVGIILFELITMKKLFFDSSEMGILKKVQDGKIIKPAEIRPGIDPALESIILKSLDKDINKRYQNAADMIKDIESYHMAHYDRLPDAVHMSHFLCDLFKGEIAKENIKLDLKPLPYEIKKLVEKPKTLELRTGIDSEEIVTERIRLPEIELVKEDEFMPVIEIDLEKDREEEEQTTPFSIFPEMEELEAAGKKKRKIFFWILFLFTALAIAVISYLLNRPSSSYEDQQPRSQVTEPAKLPIDTRSEEKMETKKEDTAAKEAQKPEEDRPLTAPAPRLVETKKAEEKEKGVRADSGVRAGKITTEAPKKTEEKISQQPTGTPETAGISKTTETTAPEQQEPKPQAETTPPEKKAEQPAESVIKEGQVFPVTELDTQPIPISTPQPKLSEIIKRSMTSEQTVMVSFLIDHNGDVEIVKLIRKSTIKKLNSLIEETVKQWKFKPAAKDNVRVKVWKTKTMTIKK